MRSYYATIWVEVLCDSVRGFLDLCRDLSQIEVLDNMGLVVHGKEGIRRFEVDRHFISQKHNPSRPAVKTAPESQALSAGRVWYGAIIIQCRWLKTCFNMGKMPGQRLIRWSEVELFYANWPVIAQFTTQIYSSNIVDFGYQSLVL